MGEWSDIAAKVARRFEVASAIGHDAVHNPTGSAAIAKILRDMGRKLDLAVEREMASKPPAEVQEAAEQANA